MTFYKSFDREDHRYQANNTYRIPFAPIRRSGFYEGSCFTLVGTNSDLVYSSGQLHSAPWLQSIRKLGLIYLITYLWKFASTVRNIVVYLGEKGQDQSIINSTSSISHNSIWDSPIVWRRYINLHPSTPSRSLLSAVLIS
jgi:hypothetical protein